MIKRLIIAVLLLGLVVGGIVGFNLFRDRMITQIFANMQPPPVAVAVIEAQPQTWRPGIETIGTARAARGVELAVEVAGVDTQILFSANDPVEEGQQLLQLDDVVERADLQAAQAALDLALSELDRFQTLQERGVVPSTNVDTAQTEATAARAQVARLTAILQQKAVVAPFEGVVGIPRVDIGQYVTPGTVYATLQDLDTMRVDFTVPEQQMRIISTGLPVTISSEVGGIEFSGTISGIEPRIDPNTRLVTLRAEVENPEGAINPGQFLRVRVELPEEQGVIVLPQTAVTSNLYGDSVYIVREGEAEDGVVPLTVEQVFVQVGRRARGLVEVLSGVSPGDRVVSAGQNRLSGGARVTISDDAARVTAEPPALLP
jgi:membrane fusion protein (multidrug efflux system)